MGRKTLGEGEIARYEQFALEFSKDLCCEQGKGLSGCPEVEISTC